MKERLLRSSVRFEAMSRREQLLVAAAAVFLPAYLIFALFVDPALVRQRALRAEVQKQHEQIAMLEQGAQRGAAAQAEPDNQQLREIALRRQLTEAEEALRSLQKALVPAQRIPGVLRDMLVSDSAVQLVSLRTLPVAPLLGDEPNPPAKDRPRETAADESPGVYKHGVEIALRGSYSALHAYLARLERSAWTMYWWRAQLSTDERPALTMTVTVYTLSLDKAWLEL